MKLSTQSELYLFAMGIERRVSRLPKTKEVQDVVAIALCE